MAVTVVQSASGSATATSLTVTLSDAVTAGNVICASVAVQDGSTSGFTVALTLGAAPDHWELCRSNHRWATGSNVYSAQWADPGCAGGSDTVTVTLSGATGGFETSIMAEVYEVAGLPGATLDIYGGTSGNSASWTTNSFSPTPSATAAAEFWWASVTYPSARTLTGPSGWTNSAPVTTSIGQAMMAGYQAVSAIGSPVYSGTLDTDAQWVCSGATLKSGTIPGTAALAGAGTLAAHGAIAGTAAPAGAGTLTAVPVAGAPDSAAPAGTGTLSGAPSVDIAAGAILGGAGALTGAGAPPVAVGVVNQWAGTVAQNSVFGPSLPASPEVVVFLDPSASVGGGSGYPTAGNWLFAVAGWRQDPGVPGVTVNVGSDDHQWWRPAPPSDPGGNTRATCWYQPNIGAIAVTPARVYVAPSGLILGMSVLVVEVVGLGDWDYQEGIGTAYKAGTQTLTLTLAL